MAIEPSSEALEHFRKGARGPFVLTQLLRFAEGGREKYLEYSVAAQPILMRLGAQIVYAGECVEPLLAGEGQAFDGIVVVRYPSRDAYLSMLADPAYQGIVHLRREALEEAVLLPTDDWAAP